MESPLVVVVLSGKRKSGKDFIAEKLRQEIGCDICTILRLSGPLKKQYAEDHNLDLERLLDSSTYKEKFREDMIKWGEEKRNKDPEFFCRLSTLGDTSDKSVWIISDARRTTDIEYFLRNYSDITLTVRIEADLLVRESRGFTYQKGVDDAESECGLDNYDKWDFILHNNEHFDNQKVSYTGFSTLKNIVKKKLEDGRT